VTLVDPVALLRDAATAGTGVGAFNVIQLEHAEALVGAAESVGVPVVLQMSQHAVRYHGALEPLLEATLAVARASSAPVVVHLDHAEDRDLVDEAVRLGVGSVMYDGSRLPYAENVSATASVVAMCHAAGVAVEAELGEVGGKDGVHAPGARTDPGEAADFVTATGVDSLAVAVGTSHAMTSPGAVVDLDLVRALRAAVPVPLVLHGSSGLDDAGLRAVVAAGITKVNVGTRLNVAMTRAVRAALAGDPRLVDPRGYLRPARDAIRAEAATVLACLA
jgi:fructose-bisphosphate aldolase, class II